MQIMCKAACPHHQNCNQIGYLIRIGLETDTALFYNCTTAPQISLQKHLYVQKQYLYSQNKQLDYLCATLAAVTGRGSSEGFY